MIDDQDFILVQGEARNLRIPVLDANGSSKDLSGATVTWVLVQKAGDVPVVTKTMLAGVPSGDVGFEGGAVAGILLVHLLPADTVTLVPRVYLHECRVTDVGGNVAVVTRGKCSLLRKRVP